MVWLVGVLVIVMALVVAPVLRARRRRGEEIEIADDPSRRERDARQERRLLSPVERARYLDGWRRVEARFAADPAAGIALADLVIRDIAVDRGYPPESFPLLAEALAEDFPRHVDDLYAAHTIVVQNEHYPVGEKALRQAMRTYRTLFAYLTRPERRFSAVGRIVTERRRAR
jgi:hypothetical protein